MFSFDDTRYKAVSYYLEILPISILQEDDLMVSRV